jgi:tetratricopeptide (TPR) repeat protein
MARGQLAWCYTLQGRYEEALAEYKKMEGNNNDGYKGFLYAVMGQRGEALKVIENMKRLSAHAYVDPYEMAIAYAGLGDKDQAMKWLTKAYEERSTEMPQVKVEPFFDNLRSDPRFQDLVRRMKFPD